MASRRDRGDGALYQEAKSGRWVGRVVVDGRRRKVTATTKTEAQRRLRELRRLADAGLPVGPGDLTVATLLADWMAKSIPNRNLAPSTVVKHRSAIRMWTDEIGTKRVRTLTPDAVEGALERRVADGMARGTAAAYRSTLDLALAWAERRGIAPRNVAKIAELPANAERAKPGRALTAEQADALLVAAEGTPLEAMWATMVYLGLRPGEAAGLSWDDVDLEHGIVHVRRARSLDGRGGAVIGKTKTAHSVRSLDAPQSVVAALKAHRRAQARQRLAAGELWANPEDLVFTSPTGRATDPPAVRREFRAVVKRARLGPGWSPNSLRHTAASLASDAGAPIEELADQLGHRDTRMASLHYRHRVKPTVSVGLVLGDVIGRS